MQAAGSCAGRNPALTGTSQNRQTPGTRPAEANCMLPPPRRLFPCRQLPKPANQCHYRAPRLLLTPTSGIFNIITMLAGQSIFLAVTCANITVTGACGDRRVAQRDHQQRVRYLVSRAV